MSILGFVDIPDQSWLQSSRRGRHTRRRRALVAQRIRGLGPGGVGLEGPVGGLELARDGRGWDCHWR